MPNRKNQPPTGEGKNQPRHTGGAQKLEKRSVVAQADRDHPEQNLGTSGEEYALRAEESRRPRRDKAGR